MEKSSNIVLFALISIAMFFLFRDNYAIKEKNVVSVYGWYGIIPNVVFKDFEKETGIQVIYDVFDNNDSLEAKILATDCGYDVVFPSFIPYAARQAAMGGYQQINYNKIPNFKHINSVISNKMLEAGGDPKYLIPFYWGTVGIGINKELVCKLLPNESIYSYDILLNPEKLKVLSKYGVSFPEEFIDIFPQVMVYLSKDPNKKSLKNLTYFRDHFKKIRKLITKFSSSTIMGDLLAGNVCAGIGTSDNIYRAMSSPEQNGKKIEYILPKEGGILWLDCLCIPKFAPHLDNAHKFIDYLLRSDVCKKIAEHSGVLIAVNSIMSQLRGNDVFPSDEVIKSIMIGKASIHKEDMVFDKSATRVWTQIRLNNFEGAVEE